MLKKKLFLCSIAIATSSAIKTNTTKSKVPNCPTSLLPKSINTKATNKYTIYSTELTTKLALEGIGIGWGLKKCVQEYINNKELYEIPVDFNIPKTKFSIAYDSNFLNNTTSEFINFFKEEIKNNL